MKKVFICYANEPYAQARDFCAKMALKRGGFDKAIAYKPEDVDESFKRENALIFSQKRGAGLWLWKPYIILKTLQEELEEGDILFYGDSGSYFFRNCNAILDSMGNEDIWVSNISLLERQYTKQDAFDALNANTDQIRNSAQIQGSFVGLRKSQDTIQLVKEWLSFCENYDILSDGPSANPNCKDFIAHREDQSILSLLCKKKGVVPHLDPTQYAKYPLIYLRNGGTYVDTDNQGEYKPCIAFHRSPKITLMVILRPLLYIYLPQWIIKMLSRDK